MQTTPAVPSGTPQMSPLCLSKADVCTRLQISARCLEGLIGRGQFPAGVRIGKHVFFSKAVVDEWLKRQFAVQERFFVGNGQ